MFETIKGIGSFLGLFTSIAFFYDRMSKGRPIGSLTITMTNERKFVCIRLSNPSDYDIAVIGADVIPNIYFLTEDQEVISLIKGQTGSGPIFMLKPKQEKALIVNARINDGVPLELSSSSVKFRIYWRRGNATWLKQWPVHVCTSTKTIRQYGLQTE